MAAMLVSGRSLATRKGRCFHFRQIPGNDRIARLIAFLGFILMYRPLPGFGSGRQVGAQTSASVILKFFRQRRSILILASLNSILGQNWNAPFSLTSNGWLLRWSARGITNTFSDEVMIHVGVWILGILAVGVAAAGFDLGEYCDAYPFCARIGRWNI